MKMSQATKGFLLMRATELSPNTLEIYRWALTRLCQFLHDPETEKITDQDLQRFFLYLQTDYKPFRRNGDTGPLKPRSIENAWTAIRSFFNWAMSELNLIDRPDRKIRRPRYKLAEIVPLTEEEIKKLLKACEYTSIAKTTKRKPFAMRRNTASRDIALLLIFLDTGLRISEVGRLRIKDVNLESREVFIQPWGTGNKTKSRTVFIGKATKRAVWHYLNIRKDARQGDNLFISEKGRPMDRNSIGMLFRELGKRTGIKRVHAHLLRHTFSIQYLRNGGDVFSLQRLLGHSSLDMVLHYVALAQTDIENAHRLASPADNWHL